MTVRRPAEHWMDLDGRAVHFLRLPATPAAGPALLLLHGIACSTGTWAPFVAALAGREDSPAVLVPDLPAHGRSAKPDRILGMVDYADWTERLLRRIDAPRVDVVGHSMGCQIALALAEMQPDRVRRLVLLGPTTGRNHVSTLRNLLGLAGDSTREPLPYSFRLIRTFLGMGPARYLLTVGEMQRDDAFARARRVRAPVRVLRGSRDLIVPERAAKDLAWALPEGDYAEVSGAAHAAQFSHPARTVDLVLAFLERGET